jgi:hypothetical protein
MDKKHEIYEISDDEPTLLDMSTAANNKSKSLQNNTKTPNDLQNKRETDGVKIKLEDEVVHKSDINSNSSSILTRNQPKRKRVHGLEHDQEQHQNSNQAPKKITNAMNMSCRVNAAPDHMIRLTAAPIEFNLSKLSDDQLKAMVAKGSQVLVSRGSSLPQDIVMMKRDLTLLGMPAEIRSRVYHFCDLEYLYGASEGYTLAYSEPFRLNMLLRSEELSQISWRTIMASQTSCSNSLAQFVG